MAQTKRIRLSDSFGSTLKKIVDYTDDVTQHYATITSKVIIRHSEGRNIKEMLKDLKDDITNELNELKIRMTVKHKNTGKMEEKICIQGCDLVSSLANDWDLQEVINFVYDYKQGIDNLSIVDGNKFENQNKYLKSLNALKTCYEKLQNLCNMFVMFDIMNQLSRQL